MNEHWHPNNKQVILSQVEESFLAWVISVWHKYFIAAYLLQNQSTKKPSPKLHQDQYTHIQSQHESENKFVN